MRHLLFVTVCICLVHGLLAQSVGIGTVTPDPSAKLDIASDAGGLLIPRMTASQRNDITDPATGLMVFVTTDSTFYYYDGSAWITMDSRTKMLTDADADTRVEVERTTDDDIIRFASRHDQIMIIDSTGNIGIGDSMPPEKLTLRGGNFLQKPVNPALASSLGIGPDPRGVYVSGRYAYVVDLADSSFRIIDVTDPASPAQVGSLAIAGAYSVYVSGRYAYVADLAANALKVIDVSKPSAPLLVGSVGTSLPIAVSVSGIYAYVIDHGANGKLLVVDVSDPTSPTIVGSIVIGLDPTAMYLSGRYVYIVDYSSDDLKVVDVSNPGSPTLTGSLGIGPNPRSVYVSGRYAYVADRDAQDLKVIDVSNPMNPTLTGSVFVGIAFSVYVCGRYAYVCEIDANQLRVIDVAKPGAPVQIGSLEIGPAAENLFVSGRYAYVTDRGDNDLKVIDISGADVTSLMAHSLEAGNLQVRNDIVAQGQLHVTGAINVGSGGIYSDGDIGISGDVNAAGRIGIGTASPNEPLEIAGTGRAFFGDGGGLNRKGILIDGIEGGGATHIEAYDYQAETGLNLILNSFGGGNIGIGTTTPTKAKVEIAGSASNNLSYGFLNVLGNVGTASGINNYSLYADQRIAASEFNAHSDARIKRIMGVSDKSEDLQTLMGIRITDYRLIDTITLGSVPQKKVIAQEVASVYPQAVSTNLTEVIPDIYQRAPVQDGWIMLSTDLKAGERVRIITDTGAGIYEILKAESTRFTVNWLLVSDSQPSDVFVYGREIDDFHSVDYDAIAMLNVSATQEQQRLIEAQQKMIAKQENLLEDYRAAIETLAERVTELEVPTSAHRQEPFR